MNDSDEYSGHSPHRKDYSNKSTSNHGDSKEREIGRMVKTADGALHEAQLDVPSDRAFLLLDENERLPVSLRPWFFFKF